MVILFAGMGLLDSSIKQNKPASNVKNSALAALGGEFRTVFANLLWIKAEKYHHEYIVNNGDWTQNTDVLGLDKLITKLDPHFVEAYAAGARMLIGMNKPDEARDYLKEGITNNPNSMMLHDELGTMAARHLRDYKCSLFHLKRAYILADDNWDKRRLRKLINTVEEMAREESGESKSAEAKPEDSSIAPI